jgi:hypothetical protein
MRSMRRCNVNWEISNPPVWTLFDNSVEGIYLRTFDILPTNHGIDTVLGWTHVDELSLHLPKSNSQIVHSI